MEIKTVSIIGLGYIGLPTAAVVASRGVKVIGVDVIEDVVNTINSGKVHIIEPGLEDLVKAVVNSNLLEATLKPKPADVFVIAVPTPFKNADHEPDLTYVHAATKAIAPVLQKGNLVILESTSPVGTTEKICMWLKELRPDLEMPCSDFAYNNSNMNDIYVAYCPERVLPGKVLEELVANDRVIGGMTPSCTEHAENFYKVFVRGACIATSARTAEMVKLTENSFRDVNIAFANELSLICDDLNIDVWELISLANRHPRVNILQPGPGVGGHCIAVDPWFIVYRNPSQAKLIRSAREVNDFKADYVVNQISHAIESHASKKPKVAYLGLAFKPNIDDLRESPALNILKKLAPETTAEFLVVEPHIKKLPLSLNKIANVSLSSYEDALQVADVIAVLVKHDHFSSIRGMAPKATPIYNFVSLDM